MFNIARFRATFLFSVFRLPSQYCWQVFALGDPTPMPHPRFSCRSK
jgi:hypothetical protein